MFLCIMCTIMRTHTHTCTRDVAEAGDWLGDRVPTTLHAMSSPDFRSLVAAMFFDRCSRLCSFGPFMAQEDNSVAEP